VVIDDFKDFTLGNSGRGLVGMVVIGKDDPPSSLPGQVPSQQKSLQKTCFPDYRKGCQIVPSQPLQPIGDQVVAPDGGRAGIHGGLDRQALLDQQGRGKRRLPGSHNHCSTFTGFRCQNIGHQGVIRNHEATGAGTDGGNLDFRLVAHNDKITR